MQTTLDLPQQELEAVDRAAANLGISRDEFVRRALEISLAQAPATPPLSEEQQLINLNQAYGIWKDRAEDGLAYQLRMRAEWDREWDPD